MARIAALQMAKNRPNRPAARLDEGRVEDGVPVQAPLPHDGEDLQSLAWEGLGDTIRNRT